MRKWYSLRDKVYQMENLRKSFQAVKANKGAPGMDGETIEAFEAGLSENLQKLHEELKTGTYQPQPVRRTYIEKEDKSLRPLGIPAIRDRVAQQALKNVLEPIFDPDFHPSSYGYRPGKSCQHAIAKAERFMNKYGLTYVADMDLSKCFDTLDHELIIRAVNRKVSDGQILKLVRQFLKSGVMEEGVVKETELGAAQGGPISPLLMNIYLDEFDQKMKAAGIRIVRYADDILIFGKSRKQVGQYMACAIEILEKDLKLKVNREKTCITSVHQGVAYLGVNIYEKWVAIHPKRIKRFKDKIKKLTKRNQGKNLENVTKELNPVLRGWVNYFRIANCKALLEDLMGWIRRRLRMKKMKEWKSWKALHKQLRRMGYHGNFEKISVTLWRNSASPLISMALPNRWFDTLKLFDMTKVKVGILPCYYE
ncbi:Group II intron-encoded protein LtrA [Pelotomaculum schinkii]|uniref:Group II intron-encoded protein LtrA n=1 Tax=Pelotomaculum schinkii TaxID=78350 RepID=A0A4Y7RAC4_9FIRM|nr:group II intron reverse transcriptase/maturase [Pelotomaculum schinkii]TEB05935.1 Group II intron-encoded protein LtrA [Pelotomaculum schinkii]